MKKFTFIAISFLCFSTFAGTGDLNFTVGPNSAKKDSGELQFFAPPNHHFNAQAPSRVSAMINGKWQVADKMEAQGNKFLAQWSKTFDPCQGVKAELYVCDDKNTYCLPRTQIFKCSNGKLTSSGDKVSNEIEPTEVGQPKALTESKFIVNDGVAALKLARETHKPLFIDFYGIWCPPCNELNETVFNSPEFDKAQNNFVLLKLDVDSPSAWAMKSQYHVTGYPTVIMATETGDEISRIIGYHPKHEFVVAMEKAYKNREKGLEILKEKAETSDIVAYDVGLKYLDREDYYKAHYYLLKASRHWSLPDIKRNKLMSAQLGLHSKAESLDDKKIYLKLLSKALEWYPRQIEVFDRTDQLIDVAQELNDKDAEKQAYNIRAETALWYIGHPKALRGTEWVRGDLYEVLGRAYEVLDDKQKSLDAFAQGAQEYLREIVRSGLSEESERGYNLERIYCLWKSGQIDAARTLYTKFEKQFPEEFTFYYQHAKLLKEIKEYKEGIEKAERAYKYSYGDNKLRATALLADLYQSSNEKKKALEVLNKVIDHFELPPDKSIRTHHYYQALVEMKKKI